ncbi:hypothetical protein NEDG_00690 [Nematocida displodere]|uniref:Glycoside hydrolase family 19 catalytic domain-containing protein n=1 Tax=Nematocida displodere TaxID=1805483 RepID=A0A177EC92_9MICR|nr:hypothetical protein NEDG_00690 [Nematocida displodere]
MAKSQNSTQSLPGQNLGLTSQTMATAPAAPAASGGSKLSEDTMKQSLSACGYSGAPKSDFVTELINQINKQSWDSNQTSMFLAQIFHESQGLTQLQEQACVSTPCTQYDGSNGSSVTGVPGQHYFGRGYMQLTWPSNYNAASNALYKNNSLLQNPGSVASDKSIAAATSIWFWNTNVMTSKAPLTQFGLTTKAINGSIECGKGQQPAPVNRWQNYQKIAKVLGVTNLASESGCYN